MARYQEIADSLRSRIQAGEWPVGAMLPGINALQDVYVDEDGNRPGLNTIRAAQQLLVEEGMLTTRQGVGAIVTSAKSLRQVDVIDTLKRAQQGITTAIAALEAPTHAVTLDLSDEHAYFVLTDALGEWAHRQRGEAQDELADDPQDTTAASRLEWAATADKLLDQIEAAL
ncbi:GntR family transcriptional regulator [Actinoallomurus oryzae]